MPSRFTWVLTTSITIAFLIFGANATAQGDGGKVDDATVARFVDAYSDVKKIQSDYTRQMKSITDADKTRELQQEAEKKMQDAVTRNNMSLDEYRKIAQRVTRDAEFRERVQAELESK